MILPVLVESWIESASPADLFCKLPAQPGRFILESQVGPADIARFSFLGHRPFMCLRSRGRRITLIEGRSIREWDGDPFAALQEQLARYPASHDPGLPPFAGGAVGYLSYDLGRQLERVPDTALDDLHLPELCLSFYDHLVAIDHQTARLHVLALPLPGRESQAVTSARELARTAQGPGRRIQAEMPPARPLVSNFTQINYRRAVERAQDYIARGHIYQVNLAQRFSTPLASSPEALYLRLREQNPAPFAAYVHSAEAQVLSTSPERFLHLHSASRRVETRPIKGTRPRGHSPAADDRLRTELLASEKDRAELVMIVDLERNDLGRVCEYGTVRVPDLRRIEAYPTVWHTVATVEGRLRQGATVVDLLRAAFPGGSVTGAPKVRAMQIIEELEGLRRHVYCGAIGYVSFAGGTDLNIAIRTITIKDDLAYFHAGGGIVADSDPDAEYAETLHKARGLAHALNADTIEARGQSSPRI